MTFISKCRNGQFYLRLHLNCSLNSNTSHLFYLLTDQPFTISRTLGCICTLTHLSYYLYRFSLSSNKLTLTIKQLWDFSLFYFVLIQNYLFPPNLKVNTESANFSFLHTRHLFHECYFLQWTRIFRVVDIWFTCFRFSEAFSRDMPGFPTDVTTFINHWTIISTMITLIKNLTYSFPCLRTTRFHAYRPFYL